MRLLCTMAVTVAIACAAGLSATPVEARPAPCGGPDHIISAGHSGVVILAERDVACRAVVRLGQALLRDARRPTPRRPARLDRFLCRDVVVGRGQHAVRCTSGRAMVLFGLE